MSSHLRISVLIHSKTKNMLIKLKEFCSWPAANSLECYSGFSVDPPPMTRDVVPRVEVLATRSAVVTGAEGFCADTATGVLKGAACPLL